jgi:prevent-host-death family protein
MRTINISPARATLSQLVAALEAGQEIEIIIARHNKPVARLLPIAQPTKTPKRIGVAAGKFDVPESIDLHNAEVLKRFTGQAC